MIVEIQRLFEGLNGPIHVPFVKPPLVTMPRNPARARFTCHLSEKALPCIKFFTDPWQGRLILVLAKSPMFRMTRYTAMCFFVRLRSSSSPSKYLLWSIREPIHLANLSSSPWDVPMAPELVSGCHHKIFNALS